MVDDLIRTIKLTKLDVPAIEPILLVAILAVCIVLRYQRWGLVVAYIFTFRWCWIIASDLSLDARIAYVFFGALVGILGVIGMLREAPHGD
jgi:hypothetical protein